jgi:predicted nucleic acid-binding protein
MNSKKIFIDSSALYSFIDRADPNHSHAIKIIESLSLSYAQLYTSIQAISDTYSAVESQLGASISLDFLKTILESNIEIIYPQKADISTAYRLLNANRGKQITFREALNASLMQKKGIIQILTFRFWHNLLGSQTYLSRF